MKTHWIEYFFVDGKGLDAVLRPVITVETESLNRGDVLKALSLSIDDAYYTSRDSDDPETSGIDGYVLGILAISAGLAERLFTDMADPANIDRSALLKALDLAEKRGRLTWKVAK